MQELTNAELLRRKDIIKLVFFFELFNFFYLGIKTIVLLDTWVSMLICDLATYFLLLLITDMLCMLINIHTVYNLYNNDYKYIRMYLETSQNEQAEMYYSNDAYLSFLTLLETIQNNYSLFYTSLGFIYIAITIYGIIMLCIGIDCEDRTNRIVIAFIVMGSVYFLWKMILKYRLHQKQKIYDLINLSNKSESQDECCICLMILSENVAQLRCKHRFHQPCIQEWFNMNHPVCPICKREYNIIAN